MQDLNRYHGTRSGPTSHNPGRESLQASGESTSEGCDLNARRELCKARHTREKGIGNKRGIPSADNRHAGLHIGLLGGRRIGSLWLDELQCCTTLSIAQPNGLVGTVVAANSTTLFSQVEYPGDSRARGVVERGG